MRSPQDIDVLILMATAIASKRRPAELFEIVAAADLLQGFIPYADKLGEAIQQLSADGLIGVVDGGFMLTQPAQEMMAEQPKKADMEARSAALKASLARYASTGACLSIVLTAHELSAAILAHKSARKTPGKNLLMPKPKPDRHFKVDGRWQRAAASRGRKS